MNATRSTRRRFTPRESAGRFLYRLGLILCLALFQADLQGAEEQASSLNGRWKWTFTMPDGQQVSPVVKLRYDGTHLTGTSRFRHATETPISEARVAGNKVSFEVMREINGRRVITRYQATHEQDSLRGTMESNWDGERRSYPWEAKRLPDVPDGTWKWITTIGERKLEFTLKARQEGDKVQGKLAGRKGLGVDIRHGRFQDGELSFEADRERDGEKFLSKFKGRVVGDFLRGKETIIVGDQTQVIDWVASRTD